MLRLRQRLIPLVSLLELLHLAQPTAGGEEPVIVIAQVGAALLGLMVDQVFDTEEIVVKPVAPILRHIAMFGGSTILGDGSVIMILDPNGIARASGINIESEAQPDMSGAAEERGSESRTPMLLFRAGEGGLMAVPLGLVTRIEQLPRTEIERCGDALVTQYRGRLMPLVAVSAEPPQSDGAGAPVLESWFRAPCQQPMATEESSPRAAGTSQPVLVFTESGRVMGLMVDEIIDAVEDRLEIEMTAARPGLLGTAVICGRATGVIDTGYWLTHAWQAWFGHIETAQQGMRILAVDESDFVRQLLVPSLAAAGYRVTAAANASAALRLHEAGERFDAIVCDVEMPVTDGLTLARTLRSDRRWAALPMIALSTHDDPDAAAATRAAGFDDHIAKFNREALLASLRHCLAATATA